MSTNDLLKKLNFVCKTQENLAQKLGISFVTINSWLNKKSSPRKKHLDKIKKLYEEYFGLEKISSKVLKNKKQQVSFLPKFILNDLLKSSESLQELIVKLTYNTNSIEGSTVTEADTREIITYHKIFNNYSLREQLEVQNHKKALIYTLELAKAEITITEKEILQIHKILMGGILENAGLFRNHAVRILGTGVPTANYLKITELINDFLKHFHLNEKDKIKQLAVSHATFEKIHPFSDGNGRVGRLLLLLLGFKHQLPPIIFPQEKKQAYYKYLQEAQISENFDFLSLMICDLLLE